MKEITYDFVGEGRKNSLKRWAEQTPEKRLEQSAYMVYRKKYKKYGEVAAKEYILQKFGVQKGFKLLSEFSSKIASKTNN